MKSTSMQGGPRGPKIVHRWTCTLKGPHVEEVTRRANDQAVVVSRCLECGGSDETEPPNSTMIGSESREERA